MWNNFLLKISHVAGDVIFTLFVFAVALPLFFIGFNNEYFFLYLTLVCVVMFPVLDYYYGFIRRIGNIQTDKIMSLEKIDLVLAAQTTSQLVNAGIEQILAAFSVRSGKLIIYNKNSDSYDIYEQNGMKKKVIHDAPIDRDNPIIRHFINQNVVVYTKRLSLSIGFEKRLIDEMKHLECEIAVPIFYYERFLGVLLLGERRQRYSSDEISLLMSFASKIGILFLNSFLWKETLSKGDIKREYEKGTRVQKRFNAEPSGREGNLEYSILVKEAKQSQFYYSVYPSLGETCVTAYCQTSDQPGAFVFSPLLIPLMQTFSRFGYHPAETVERTMRIVSEKTLIEGDFPILQISFGKTVRWARKGFSSPLVYDPSTEVPQFVRDDNGQGEMVCRIGSLMLFFDDPFIRIIGSHYEEILLILGTHTTRPLPEIGKVIMEKLSEYKEAPDLLCLLRVVK